MPKNIVKDIAAHIIQSYGELKRPSDARIEKLVCDYLTGNIVRDQCLEYVIENQNIHRLSPAKEIQQAS